MSEQQELLRMIPSVDRVLGELFAIAPKVTAFLPHDPLADLVRSRTDAVREWLCSGQSPTHLDEPQIMEMIVEQVCAASHLSLRPVVNATGVILHTNLGRSCLAERAVEAISQVARNYSTLEYDTASCQRGSRQSHCARMLSALTGAEDAMVVNNNAAAVMLVLAEFAGYQAGCGEVIISRGELVEIGGSFRIPDIIAQTGARMVEVGTTNKTHLADYQRALSSRTALIAKVHPSNFHIVGFTESVGIAELAALRDDFAQESPADSANGDAAAVLLYEDQGAGQLFELPIKGAHSEPIVSRSIAQGADLVSFSADKLLGGPQAGIIVGRRELLSRLKANPLARVLRPDKLTLAALEATLCICLDEKAAFAEIPTLRMLTMDQDTLSQRAEELSELLAVVLPEGCCTFSVEDSLAMVGGGSLPVCELPSKAVAVQPATGNLQALEAHLAARPAMPIIARKSNDYLLFDVRTLRSQDELSEIAMGLKEYFAGLGLEKTEPPRARKRLKPRAQRQAAQQQAAQQQAAR